MGDSNGIFSVPLDGIIPLSSVEITSKSRNDDKIRSHIKDTFSKAVLTHRCEQLTLKECNLLKSKTDEFIDKFIQNPYINGVDTIRYADTARVHSFQLWKVRDDVYSYFCSRGAYDRLKYVFDMRDGEVADPHAGEYILPTGDLRKCWDIMEAGVSASANELLDHSLPNLVRLFLLGIIYTLLAMNAVFLAYQRLVMMSNMGSSRQCSSQSDLLDPTSMTQVLCTNVNYAGSICVAQCLPGYGESSDGIVRSLMTICRDGTWQPQSTTFLAACLTSDQVDMEIFT